MTFSDVNPYQCKDGDILLSANVTISGSTLKNFDSTHKLGNTITQTNDNTRVPQALVRFQAKVLLPIWPRYPNRIPMQCSPSHRTQVGFGPDTLGEGIAGVPVQSPPMCPCPRFLAHQGHRAATHSGPLPWLHSDWILQWGHTRTSLPLGRRQTRTCSNPWKETQKYQYTTNHHFLGTEAWHQCCSAAQVLLMWKPDLVPLPHKAGPDKHSKQCQKV